MAALRRSRYVEFNLCTIEVQNLGYIQEAEQNQFY